MYCGKGLDVVATAIFKAKSKSAGIGDRTQDLEVRSPANPNSFTTKGCGKGISGASPRDSNPNSFTTKGCGKGILDRLGLRTPKFVVPIETTNCRDQFDH